MPDVWPDGYVLLKDNVVPLHLEPIELPAKALIDGVGEDGQSAKILRSYRAVAAVADVVYHSGRVIPAEVQERALQRAHDAKRQMTMYIDHPAPGINCADYEAAFGRIEFAAGIATTWRFDAKSGQTVLDRIDIPDVEYGRKLIDLLDGGFLIGLSQRALGRQEPATIELNGEELTVMLVTDIADIFGWDFLHLDTANAGHITKLEPLSDKALRSLARPDRLIDKKEPVMGKNAQDAKDPKSTNEQINDSQTTPKPASSDTTAAQEQGAKLAEENKALIDSIEGLLTKIEETATGFKSLNDDFKSRYMTAEAEESLYNRTYTAIRCARQEVYSISHDEGLTVSEKNTKLQDLLTQMKETFAEISEAYVKAHMKAEDGGPAEEEAMADKARPRPSGGTDENVVPLRDKQDKPLEYVPPTQAAPTPANDATSAAAASKSLRDSVADLVKVQEEKRRLVDLRTYAQAAIERQKLDEGPKKAVISLVDRTIHTSTTKEQIEDAIKSSIELVKAGQATERLNGMGLEQPQGVGSMRISDVREVHSLGADHLQAVKVLTDSFARASNGYQVSYPERAKVPPKLQEVLDKFDQQFAAELAREKQLIMDKLKAQREGATLFDASAAADFQTPATLSRMVLFEVYAADILREVTDFGTMDNHRDSIPITRWRRDDGNAATFRPSVLQRHSVKGGELSPMATGKLTTEFFDIDAVARKLQATLSLEFITRSKRRTDIAGTAMALQNLQEEIKRILLMDVFFEQIRAAAFHGSSAFTTLIAGTGTSTYRVHGTTDANTTTIVPNDPRSPLQVFLGTTSANRTEVPEYGTSTVGGGPGNSYFYTIEHSTSKITFVDAAGVAQNTATAADCIQVVGYKADKEVRFDLKLPASTRQEQHMNDLLFAVANQRAALSSGGISNVGFYNATSVLASGVTSEFMKQAAAYQADGRRNAYRADADVNEGNYGYTAGLAHWGSKIFPDDFIVIMDRMGVAFRVYEPTHLRGPIEARNSSGQLIGGEEYYAYQEDAIDTPLVEKFSLVTLYRSS